MSNGITGETPFRVRPYLLTGGRTRSSVELALEAQIRATPEGHAALANTGMELRQIISLCAEPQSVAEISAHLKIHLQVARVLVGDLINEGLIAVQTATEQSTERPDLLLLNRVLDGLQAL